MNADNTSPNTLMGAINYFADVDIATAFLAGIRWPDGVACPHCAGKNCPFVKSRRIWQCKDCRKQFSVKVGSIFEDSPIPLSHWLPAMWMLVNCKNGISSYEIARDLGVTQKSAWFMLHRLRLAIQSKSFEKIGGKVEIDETYIGGKARYATKRRIRTPMKGRATGLAGKAVVMGLLDRHTNERGHSTVRTIVVKSPKKNDLIPLVHDNVEKGSEVFTDALMSYRKLGTDYVHAFIDHAETYADGQVHTNGLENFWSLLKRAIKGTYVSIEPFHLFRYLDEQAYRFNTRKDSDGKRFLDACKQVFGKRLTYAVLTGSELPQTT